MAHADVLVIGEALFDVVVDADLGLVAHAGGGPYNVARAVGRLGGDVAFLGGLSRDRFGRALRARLQADGIALHAVHDSSAPTTLAVVELDPGGDASYGFHLAGTAAAEVPPAAARALVPAGVSAVVAGTLGLLAEPVASAAEATIAALGADVLVVIDPNVRPAAVADEDAYRARLGRLLARADVVKASDDDLAWLRPGVEPSAAAAALLADGARVVLRTRGADGVVVVTAGGTVDVPARAVDVVDTIGAGDAFLGAWVAEWRARGRGRDALADPDALRATTELAARAAAITCSRAGAEPPTRAELDGD